MLTSLSDGIKDVIPLFHCASFINVDHNDSNFEYFYLFPVF